jgi:hypothetical protein
MELDPQKNPINQVAFVVWLVVKEHPSLLDKQPIMIIKEFQNHLLEEFQKYSEFISGRSEASPHHLKGK